MVHTLTTRQFLLLLRYSGFTTRQIYNYCPNMMTYNGTKQALSERLSYDLSQFNDVRLQAKLQRFNNLDLNAIEQQLSMQQIEAISIDSPDYPPLLKHIYDPPTILFCRGNLQLLQHTHTLGIVGSRQHTHYTNKALKMLFPYFAKARLTIISGLANGADTIAHQYAIQFGCATIAVLGFGHLHHYPKQTRVLRRHIDSHFLSISEYPPHTRPAKFRFPERNRLISGLSRGVLITEAKERSGALITVDQALDQNRNVYVLPGDMFNSYTKGNMLRVQEGAEVVLSETDILKDYC
ncbi:DNA-processing protein DprA [Staphylococcus americanisciuri]|uniref:DNA-processing protein DprA n=1 Tax=Staphylococcus americanisciuri TaxID=2973940 RepID=A0ABT2F1C9_9STAP|nr:DNA-processing protein DprA [Staphylococcus americanisciuri]MCS4486265.1 DNA-processing protein DprA [Staphylococcus americanisciuri]